MKQNVQLLALLIILFSCSPKEKEPKIEKFVWIRTNRNFISNPNDLIAKQYIEYDVKTKKMNFAKQFFDPINHITLKPTEYYCEYASQEFEITLNQSLFKKKYSLYYTTEPENCIFDGDFYCIIYKFSNNTEKIINYEPSLLPDSLKKLAKILSILANKNWTIKTESFDVTSIVEKNKNILINACPYWAPVPLVPKSK